MTDSADQPVSQPLIASSTDFPVTQQTPTVDFNRHTHQQTWDEGSAKAIQTRGRQPTRANLRSARRRLIQTMCNGAYTERVQDRYVDPVVCSDVPHRVCLSGSLMRRKLRNKHNAALGAVTARPKRSKVAAEAVPRKRKSAPCEKESTVVPAGTDSHAPRSTLHGVNRELFTELGTMVSAGIHAVHFCCFCDTAMFRRSQNTQTILWMTFL